MNFLYNNGYKNGSNIWSSEHKPGTKIIDLQILPHSILNEALRNAKS